MNINDQTRFNQVNQVNQVYLNGLTLQGKSPKTVDMYSRYLRQISFF
jgi:integrase/recombinase XerD